MSIKKPDPLLHPSCCNRESVGRLSQKWAKEQSLSVGADKNITAHEPCGTVVDDIQERGDAPTGDISISQIHAVQYSENLLCILCYMALSSDDAKYVFTTYNNTNAFSRWDCMLSCVPYLSVPISQCQRCRICSSNCSCRNDRLA